MTNKELDCHLMYYFNGRKGGLNAWQTVAEVQAWATRESHAGLRHLTYSRVRAALNRLAKQNKIIRSLKTRYCRTPKVQAVTAYHHPDLSREPKPVVPF
jgi:hypothetical protein